MKMNKKRIRAVLRAAGSFRPVLALILCSIFASTCIFSAGCSLVKAYQVDIPQGNVLDSEKMSQVKINMKRSDVIAILGEPILDNSGKKNKLTYVYTFKKNGVQIEKKRLILTFSKDRLVKTEK